MVTKALFVLSVLCLAVVGARADDSALARQMMAGATAELASNQMVSVQIAGTETIDGEAVPIWLSASISIEVVDEVPMIYLEVLTYRNNELQYRLAGDGTYLWSYDPVKKEYSSAAYGSTSGTQPSNMRQRLFQIAAVRCRGASTFLIKLLQDAFGPPADTFGLLSERWVPWMATANVTVNGSTILCESDAPTPSELVYTLEADPDYGYRLLGADFFRDLSTDSQSRIVEWTAQVFRDQLPDDVDFGFVPPPGSRAVAAALPQVGG